MPMGDRVQCNFMARRERLILDWLCSRVPPWISSDALTGLGVFGAVLIFCGYAGTRFDREFVWLASLGFCVHWLGDSLDGSLARYRRQERMRYGYFLDSTMDALCNLMTMIGVGLCSYVRMDAALFALLGYFLLCMYVFLHYHLHGVYRLSFLAVGPTEVRLGLIAMNALIFFKGQFGPHFRGLFISAYDLFMISAGTVSVALFVGRILIDLRQLNESDPPLHVPQESIDLVEISRPVVGLSGRI